MAAYSAMISLKNTIHHLLQSSSISLVPPSSEILQLVFDEMDGYEDMPTCLDGVHVSKSRKKVNDLDGQIKEAVWEFEDLLESHLYSNLHGSQFSVDLQCLQQDADSFIEKFRDLQEEYSNELINMPRVEADELVSSEFDSWEIFVGCSDKYENVRTYFLGSSSNIVALYGMPGMGKTALAKKLFKDPEVSGCFEHRIWVTLGRNNEASGIAGDILAKMDPNTVEGEELKERLKGKRCLIVLDDVWDVKVLEYLKTCLPDSDKSGDTTKYGILVTTRLSGGMSYDKCESMRLLNLDESKELLRLRVFGEKSFPSDLKEVAEKIAKNCQGLPLMILRVAHRLDTPDPQYWNEVAKRRSSVFMEAYNEISEVLFPTYDCLLPQRVKMFFLYSVAFPHDYEIRVSKLINLLTAERFTQLETEEPVEMLFSEILQLYGMMHEIVFVPNWTLVETVYCKTFCVYSWWWHLFNREAHKDKINRVFYNDEVEEGIEGHRRLCLHTNFLFNFTNVYDVVKYDCASTARSLLCFGPYQKYSMPMDVGFKLLRVVDALKVRFYTFPVEILELLLLQYLALTCNGELPASISKLFNLQFLIIHPHISVKSCTKISYLPVQIWDMQELSHLEILGGNLPKPNSVASLEKLSKLIGVNPESCTREVLKKIPNIQKLGIQIELNPHNQAERNPLSCFEHIAKELENLESLTCSVVNPEISARVTPTPTPPVFLFPSNLQKLHLSGLGYPWEYMEIIGSLPYLRVLKLRCFAFRGPKWEPESGSFLSLQYLLIEDSDLVEWKPAAGSFPIIHTLCIKYCYKLDEVHWPTHFKGKRVELVDCKPSASKKLKESYSGLIVLASFDNKELN